MDPKDALIIYNALSPAAVQLAEELAECLGASQRPRPADDAGASPARRPSVVVTVGGDGTILRAARLAAPLDVPLLGVNLGRLGFLTEVEAANALELVPRYLEPGFAWLQERSMLQAQVVVPGQDRPASVTALNDVVVGRGPTSRLPRIRVRVDGVDLATYSADAVIVASATGSTGYALSAGGPILHPSSSDMVLKAVAPHGDLAAAVLVPRDSVLELAVLSRGNSFVTADGYWHVELAEDQPVRVTSSPHKAHFLRAGTPARFYETLVYRLHRGPAPPAPLPLLAVEES